MSMQRPQDFLEFNKYVLNEIYYFSGHKEKNLHEPYILSYKLGTTLNEPAFFATYRCECLWYSKPILVPACFPWFVS